MSVLFITGTGTGIGKTVATAALAAAAGSAGLGVSVCKPVQTGVADGDDDLAEVTRLSGVRAVHPGFGYPLPLSPAAASAAAGRPMPTRAELRALIESADTGGLTLVEGAGGLLVELADDGATIAELAGDLGAPVLVVVAPGLGTLNHTALTLEALQRRGLACAGLIIGSWPARPGAAEESNRIELARLAPLRAVLPERAGALGRAEFTAQATAAVDADWLSALATPAR